MAFEIERWDPENNGLFNTTYSLVNGNFVQGDGNFYKYTPVGANNPYAGKIGSLYWNKDDGSIYYHAGEQGWTQLSDYTDASGNDIKPMPGFWGYASDDQLDKVAAKIINLQNQAKVADI